MLSCLYSCRPTPTGGVCICPSGQMINPADNRTCIDINECEMWDECDQICVNTNNSYMCQCNANYTLLTNGHCQHSTSTLNVFKSLEMNKLNFFNCAGNSAKIMFSIGSKIYETNQQGQNLRLIFDHNDLDITSFDYNYATNTFYMADEKNNKVI